MDERIGFIHEEFDIKILILFVLRRLSAPCDIDDLAQAVICDDGISYFVFADCVADLVKTEHIVFEADKYYITDKGIRNAKITEASLPFTVRVKAEKNARALSLSLSRNMSILTSHEKRSDGSYTVKLSLSDGISPILEMSILVGTEEDSAKMEKRFRRRAEAFYNEFAKMLLEKEG